MTRSPQDVLSEIDMQKCHGVLFIAGGVLVLYLGELLEKVNEKGPLKTSWRFWIECAWRLWKDGVIVAGRYDDSEDAAALLLQLEGTLLTDATHTNAFHDLSMRFSNGMLLELFSDSTTDTQWQLRGANGYRYGIEENLQVREWTCDPDEHNEK